MNSPPETPDFKVTDRRAFRPDGSPRDTAGPGPKPETPSPESAEAPRPASPPVAAEADVAGDAAPRTVTFSGFIASLGAQALSLAADRAPERLEGVREIVAILEMLRDKTEGRRSDDESRLLEGVLFELRMTYVSRAPGPGRAPTSA